MEPKKVKICLYDVQFNGKWLSLEEGAKIYHIVTGESYEKIAKMSAKTLKGAVEGLVDSDKLTIEKMMLIHQEIERTDTNYARANSRLGRFFAFLGIDVG